MVIPEVDIIGAGNLAFNLAPSLEQNGIIINNVYSRNLKDAQQLANNLYQAQPTNNLDLSRSKSSVFFLAISDDALEDISREIILPDDAILAHTSGSKSISILGYAACANIGVFYPLQTFSKKKRVGFANVPIFIEGDNSLTKKSLTTIARKISSNVTSATSEQRRTIHLAAIFASNFTNSLLFQANEILQSAGFDLQILVPLLEETMSKSVVLGPVLGQTGPAARGDIEILEKHMEMLKNNPEAQEVYRIISQQILDRYHNE